MTSSTAVRPTAPPAPCRHHDRWQVEFDPQFGGWIVVAYGPAAHGDLVARFETEAEAHLAADAVNATAFTRRSTWEAR